MRTRYLLHVALVAMAFAVIVPAFASAPSSSNLFPDPTGIYYNTNTGAYLIPSGGVVTLEGITLSAPTGSIAPPVAPATSLWSGGKTFNAFTVMSFFGGPSTPAFNVGEPAAAKITGLADAPPLHTYSTEMLSLNLTGLGAPGAMIRESPTLVSSGGHTIVDTPPSGFQITSFFDVFTELSLDGGATWIPATGPVHIQNPEPGSLALVVCAAPLICRRRRRAV